MDWKVRYYIEFIQTRDQNVYGNRERHDKDARKKLTNDIVTELIDLFEKRGYPVDKEIGCFFLNDTTFLMNTYPLNVVITHAYQQKDFRLTPYLKKYVEEGLIKPDQFMNWNQYELTENNIAGNYGVGHFFVVNDVVYKDDPIFSVKETIDENRNEVLGCSFDRFCQKTIFQFFNKSSLYSIVTWGGVQVWKVAQDDVKMFTEGLKKTDYIYYDSNNK